MKAALICFLKKKKAFPFVPIWKQNGFPAKAGFDIFFLNFSLSRIVLQKEIP